MISASRTLQRFTPALIFLAAGIMIGILWFGAASAILEHQAASRAQVDMALQSKADLAAEEIRRELLVTDQSLRIIEMEWERDARDFNFDDWRRRLLALSDDSLQIFLTDASGIIRRSSRPDIVGDDLSGRDYFQHEAALPQDPQRMYIGSLTRGMKTGVWQINFARRLDSRDGSFAGVVVASLEAERFQELADMLDVRAHGRLIVSTVDGSVRGVDDMTLLRPQLSISGTPVFAAMSQAERGVWSGRSPLDGTERILAFATVP